MHWLSILSEHYITKIFSLSIFSIFMDSIFHREETDERGIAPARRDIHPDDRVDIGLIVGEYGIEICVHERLAGDRAACGGDDRHISIEWEIHEGITRDL